MIEATLFYTFMLVHCRSVNRKPFLVSLHILCDNYKVYQLHNFAKVVSNFLHYY